ncbi:hypothetical protein [Aeromicrobium ginsengisoli]|uniref:hypothetical protein n=1 Tax=Aeromicrobium ginsengisoli TaxID=363867 RepID=UPI00165F30AA|nr:hypothetical protein [Aeromicrobium ginsengisoli]
MIPKILHTPVSIAQHVAGGVVRGGLRGAGAVVKRVLPDHQGSPEQDPSPRIKTEPVRQPPSPTTTTKRATTNTMPAKKAQAKRAAAKKSAATRSAPKKPAAALNEDRAPVDADPVVHSTGPEVTTNVSKDDLRA